MILLHNSVIKLDYSPATDILQVDYPDLQNFQLWEIRRSLTHMVEAIRNYDVKRLLLDASRSVVEVSEEESKEVVMQLAADLAGTRLQKVARIQPLDPARETSSRENINRIRQAGLLPYQLRTFASRAEAVEWLKGDSKP